MFGKFKQAYGIAICVGMFGCGSDDPGADTDGASATQAPSTGATNPDGSSSGDAPPSTTASTSSTSAPTASTSDSTGPASSSTGPQTTASSGEDTTGGVAPNTDFEEIDGIVVFEAEHFTEQTNTDERRLRWYEVSVEGGDIPDAEIDGCVVDTPCTSDNTPLCNLYSDCDGDGLAGEGNALTDPAEASNATYLEILPDRRRADSANEEPSGGFSNTGGQVAVLTYRVFFNQTGRYYGYCRARGRGPAANGLHLGIDGQWPSNELGDNSGMRWQFPNGWSFVNYRRGQNQHTGGVNIDGVSQEDANIWFEVGEAGWHDVQVSMREDGVEIDKFMFVLDAADGPGVDELGPEETLYEE